jgi:hypothetical protein
MWMTVLTTVVVSTFFTLVLIPTLYVIFEERFPRPSMSLDNHERDAVS